MIGNDAPCRDQRGMVATVAILAQHNDVFGLLEAFARSLG
jgi:hypothetical protein